jgi:peptidoglycan/LPS O-acetylase OafA/YrhL
MPSVPRASNRIPSLDGVRAIAFGLVFVSHAGLSHAIPGGFGVMVFFVLSGFLITTLLRLEYKRNGDLSFKGFYLRRALRILPPLFVTLIFLTILHLVMGYAAPITLPGLLYPSLFLGNYFLHFDNPVGTPDGFGVVWSLAIEEHYYLLFPPLALWLFHGRSRTRAIYTLTGIIVAVLLLRLTLYFGFGVSEEYLYHATESRCDGLLMGSLLALAWNPWLDPPARQNRGLDRALLLGSLALLLLTFVVREPWFRATVRYSLQGIGLLPLLWLAVARWEWWPLRWLNMSLLGQIGDLSYTLYLVHFGMIDCVLKLWPGVPIPVLQLTALGLSIVYALLMRKYVERPMRRLGHKAGPPKPAAAVSTSDSAA